MITLTEKPHVAQDLPKAIVDCLSRLDVWEMKKLLPAGIAYHQDLDKQAFVDALFDLTDRFADMGDTALEVFIGSCHGCFAREQPRLFVLIGNNSKAGVGMYFTDTEGKLSKVGFCRYAHYNMNSKICDPVLYLNADKGLSPFWQLTPYVERINPPQPRVIPKVPRTPPGFGESPQP